MLKTVSMFANVIIAGNDVVAVCPRSVLCTNLYRPFASVLAQSPSVRHQDDGPRFQRIRRQPIDRARYETARPKAFANTCELGEEAQFGRCRQTIAGAPTLRPTCRGWMAQSRTGAAGAFPRLRFRRRLRNTRRPFRRVPENTETARPTSGDGPLLVWTRLIMPNGRSIVLERQQGADAGGYSGLEDEVDNHWAELFKAALLSTILGTGAQLGSGADSGSNTDIIQALRLSAANSLNQTGQQVVRRNLNIQPTLTIKSGFLVRVIVNRDLVFR
jgi:hypothetical protein